MSGLNEEDCVSGRFRGCFLLFDSSDFCHLRFPVPGEIVQRFRF